MVRKILPPLVASFCIQGVSAGPYAALATQVQADGGHLQLYADGLLQNRSADDQIAAALDVYHKVALEGVTVTTIDIIATDGQTILRSVDQTTLQGC